MKKRFFILCLLFVINLCFSQTENKLIEQKIDTYIKEVIELNEIPGAALAVIKDGKVIYEKYYGKASLEENTAVDKTTAFKIFSTTKLITSVGIFQLIEKEKLSLEDPISKYLNNLPKEWKKIKIKNLLTHSSGLPDIVQFEDILFSLPYSEKISLLSKKPMQFATGNQYRYNQTNYLFLAKIIEKITSLPFDEYILKNQFPKAKSDVFFLSDFGQITPKGAVRYNYDAENKKYKKNDYNSGSDSHSANGLNINLPEFIKWNKNLDADIYIKKETKSTMWKPFSFTNNVDNFAYGWEIVPVNKTLSYGFTGGNETAFRKFTNNELTVIFLSNGHKYSNLYVQSQVINHVAAIVDTTLIDDYLLAGEKINQDFLKFDISTSEQNYLVLKRNHPDWNFEYRLNVIGYTLMTYGRINDAIKVFELNAKENPTSGNAFDSLAESYFSNNQLDISKETYKKSLELMPNNSNAKEMLEKIDKIILAKKS
ncbi:serine hydrolase [Flavobacterium sp.]|uniref:serine hydrolase n=1 Tax=Flavobacterium sp. TaxID=239 RepID=UPI0032657211